jgi:hypothetical protein
VVADIGDLIAVAPSTTWLLLSTVPEEESIIPVPAASSS